MGLPPSRDFCTSLTAVRAKKLQTISIPTTADYFVRKENDLYIRGYNRDFIFGVQND